MRESTILGLILRKLNRDKVRLFRNNVGRAYYPTSDAARAHLDGMVRRGELGRTTYGLCPGSADLIGWKTATIAPEDVGRRVAIFVGIETKGPKGRVSPEQKAFVAALEAAGGMAGIARCVDEAEEIISWDR